MKSFEDGFRAGTEAAAHYSEQVSTRQAMKGTKEGDILAREFAELAIVLRGLAPPVDG